MNCSTECMKEKRDKYWMITFVLTLRHLFHKILCELQPTLSEAKFISYSISTNTTQTGWKKQSVAVDTQFLMKQCAAQYCAFVRLISALSGLQHSYITAQS